MNIVLMTKVKNAVKRVDPEGNYVFSLHNISINGNKRGCSGFITNTENNSTVYLTTEINTVGKFMYRYAKDNRDFRGYRNRWDAGSNFDKLIDCIVEALKHTPEEVREIRF